MYVWYIAREDKEQVYSQNVLKFMRQGVVSDCQFRCSKKVVEVMTKVIDSRVFPSQRVSKRIWKRGGHDTFKYPTTWYFWSSICQNQMHQIQYEVVQKQCISIFLIEYLPFFTLCNMDLHFESCFALFPTVLYWLDARSIYSIADPIPDIHSK